MLKVVKVVEIFKLVKVFGQGLIKVVVVVLICVVGIIMADILHTVVVILHLPRVPVVRLLLAPKAPDTIP